MLCIYSLGSNIKTSYVQAGRIQLEFLLLINQLSHNLWYARCRSLRGEMLALRALGTPFHLHPWAGACCGAAGARAVPGLPACAGRCAAPCRAGSGAGGDSSDLAGSTRAPHRERPIYRWRRVLQGSFGRAPFAARLETPAQGREEKGRWAAPSFSRRCPGQGLRVRAGGEPETSRAWKNLCVS